MKYEEARPLIQNGDIIFVSKATMLSRIIEFFTNSKFSHVGIAFWVKVSNNDRLMILEAQGKTSRRILNLSFYKQNSFTVVRSNVPWVSYCDDALNGIGAVKYDYITAVYTGLRDTVLKHFNYRLPTFNLSGEICSEFVAKCLNLPFLDVSPQDVYSQLTSANSTGCVAVVTP